MPNPQDGIHIVNCKFNQKPVAGWVGVSEASVGEVTAIILLNRQDVPVKLLHYTCAHEMMLPVSLDKSSFFLQLLMVPLEILTMDQIKIQITKTAGCPATKGTSKFSFSRLREYPGRSGRRTEQAEEDNADFCAWQAVTLGELRVA